jgi:glyoxylase-like metal-dependent hydrolase (beta-lactamase superfamily II)
MLFVGDTILPAAVGRVDLPGGDQSSLQSSIKKLLCFTGEHFMVFPGHGDPALLMSILETNSHLREVFEALGHEDLCQSGTRNW